MFVQNIEGDKKIIMVFSKVASSLSVSSYCFTCIWSRDEIRLRNCYIARFLPGSALSY